MSVQFVMLIYQRNSTKSSMWTINHLSRRFSWGVPMDFPHLCLPQGNKVLFELQRCGVDCTFMYTLNLPRKILGKSFETPSGAGYPQLSIKDGHICWLRSSFCCFSGAVFGFLGRPGHGSIVETHHFG